MKKQKASITESFEHARKMKEELEKRLEEAMNEKTKQESSMQEKLNNLQLLKSESEKRHADFISSNQVGTLIFYYFTIILYSYYLIFL